MAEADSVPSSHGPETEGSRAADRKWLWLGFGALAGAALMIAVVAILSLRTMVKVKDSEVNRRAQTVVLSQEYHFLAERMVAALRGYLLTGEPVFLTRLDSAFTSAGIVLDSLDALGPSTGEHELVRKIRRCEEGFLASSRMLRPLRANPSPQAIAELREAIHSSLSERDGLDNVSAELARRTYVRFQKSRVEAESLGTWLIVLVVGTTLFSLMLSAWMALRMARRLTESRRGLARSQERLDAVVASATDAIIVADAAGRIMLFNQAAVKIFGMSREDALGRPLESLFPPRFREKSYDDIKSLGFAKLYGLRADGTEFPLEATLSASRSEGEELRTLILRDATNRLMAEEVLRQGELRLRQAQKMEAIGQLAGGIAHDFNNLLTAINGYSDLTLGLLPEGHPVREHIQEIRKAGQRAATLTSQLLAYSRKQVITPKHLNLNQVVGSIVKMLRRLIPENIRIETHLEPELDLVHVDTSQMEQVIVNLALNARDAMPGGGRLDIRTSNVRFDLSPKDAIIEARPGRYVMLEMSDDGIGMKQEVLARIFEPFFTTKMVGKGTGLGLSSVYGIVQRAGGAMEVKSHEGNGSEFRVYFPRVDRTSAGGEAENDPAKPPRFGSGQLILLAEDEPAVRLFTCRTLEASGFRVKDAGDGEAALNIFREHREDVGLLVTDMVMPGMSGKELAAAARRLQPDLKILFMSGYTDEPLDYDEMSRRSEAFLAKPFSPDQLVARVCDMLANTVTA